MMLCQYVLKNAFFYKILSGFVYYDLYCIVYQSIDICSFSLVKQQQNNTRNHQLMSRSAVKVHLSIHQLSLTHKTTGLLTTQLTASKTSKTLMELLPVNSDKPIQKQFLHQIEDCFDEQTQTYQPKHISLHLQLFDKLTRNKLLAGTVQLKFPNPRLRFSYAFAKLSKCADANASLIYSLKVEKVVQPQTMPNIKTGAQVDKQVQQKVQQQIGKGIIKNKSAGSLMQSKIQDNNIQASLSATKYRIIFEERTRMQNQLNQKTNKIKQLEEIISQMRTTSNPQKAKKSKENNQQMISVQKDSKQRMSVQKEGNQKVSTSDGKSEDQMTAKQLQLQRKLINSKQMIQHYEEQINQLRQSQVRFQQYVCELNDKDEQIPILEQKIAHQQTLYEEFLQQQQIRQKQLVMEIKTLLASQEEKEQHINTLKTQLQRANKEKDELSEQSSSLRATIKHLSRQLDHMKTHTEGYKNQNRQIEAKISSLKHVQQVKLSSNEQLCQQNLQLKKLLQQSSQNLLSVGKKYECLHKSTMQALQQWMILIVSRQNIVNNKINHQKKECAVKFTDALRLVVKERQEYSQQLGLRETALKHQQETIRKNDTLLKIKRDLEEELQERIAIMQQHQSIAQQKIGMLQNDLFIIYKEHNQMKQQNNSLQTIVQNAQQIHQNALNKAQQQFQKQQQALKAQLKQMETTNANWEKSYQDLRSKIKQKAQQNLKRITDLTTKIRELQQNIREEKQAMKAQKVKQNQLQNKINSITKEKTALADKLQVREATIVSLNGEVDALKKAANVRQIEVVELKQQNQLAVYEKEQEKSQRERVVQLMAQSKQKSTSLEATLREKNSQITKINRNMAKLQQKITNLEEQKKKNISQNKQQVDTISQLQQEMVSLNRALEEVKQSYALSSYSTEPQDKLTLQRVSSIKSQLKTSQSKISTLTKQIYNTKPQSPSQAQLKQTLNVAQDLKRLRTSAQKNKQRLFSLVGKGKEVGVGQASGLLRNMGIYLSRLKIQILQGKQMPQQMKKKALEGLSPFQNLLSSLMQQSACQRV